jgi:hypothetical protein
VTEKRYVPSLEATSACGDAWNKFFDYHKRSPIPMNDSEWSVHCFSAGFHRGIAWAQERHERNWDDSNTVSRARLCPGCRSLDGEHDFGPTCTLNDEYGVPPK